MAADPPGNPREVLIDGVRYVPVSQAHIAAPAIEDAIISDWAGGNWREKYPDSINYLCVDVNEDGEGMTVPEFVARVLAEADKQGGDRP